MPLWLRQLEAALQLVAGTGSHVSRRLKLRDLTNRDLKLKLKEDMLLNFQN